MRRHGRRRRSSDQTTEVWSPEPNATIDRLAFLAARPYLERRVRPWWVRLIAAAEAGGGRSGWGYRSEADTSSELISARMADYAFSCQFVVGDLSVAERAELRDAGTLPKWFYDRLEREVRARRKSLKAVGL